MTPDPVQHAQSEVIDHSEPEDCETTHPVTTNNLQHVECEVSDHPHPGDSLITIFSSHSNDLN